MGMGTLSRNTTFGVSGDLLSEIGTRSWQKTAPPNLAQSRASPDFLPPIGILAAD